MSENSEKMVSPQLKIMSSNVLFCPSNSPKPKDVLFIILHDKEKQQILTFENLEPANVDWLLNYQNSCQFIFCWMTNR